MSVVDGNGWFKQRLRHPMTTPDFLALLLAALAKTIPGYAEMSDADRDANLTLARTLFEAFQPTDPLEAARAANAVAAGLAAMDSFARAASRASATRR